jgi:Lrp/AsnC family leucine-responsive transcriptional regulator
MVDHCRQDECFSASVQGGGMDRTDIKILEILQSEGQISNQALADRVALSPSPCLRRVKQLEAAGYIEAYVAKLSPKKLGLQLSILVAVALNDHDPQKMQAFEQAMRALPEVVQCYLIAGQASDYMLKVVVPNLDDYHAFLLKKLTQMAGVKTVESSFVLDSVVDQSALPLGHL